MATPAELRRLNRLNGLNRRDRAAQLDPQTHEEVLAATAGAIQDEYPKAKITPSDLGAHVINVTLPEADGGEFVVGVSREGQIIARRPR